MLDHAFRKFCNTKMIGARVEHNTKEFLLGHKVSRELDNEYDRTPVHNRLTEYLKAVPYLTISKEHVYREKYMEADLTATQRVEALRREKDREVIELTDKYKKLAKDHNEFRDWARKVIKTHDEIN